MAAERAYHPFLAVLREYPEFRLAVHVSGVLLEWLRDRASSTFDLLGELAARGQAELLTGGYYEPILPILPDWDKIGQIRQLSEFLNSYFGVKPRGLWLAERVWEPHLPKPLSEAGVDYVLVDDSHFALAGLDPSDLSGYYLTEEQGATLAVFPISRRLRYLVPFADPVEALAYLAQRRGSADSLTLADDGEKFGVWPGTHRLSYEERWLARFLEALLGTAWLEVDTFSGHLDRRPPTARVYLPTASYKEMGEWALPARAALELEETKQRILSMPEGERAAEWLRGGFWRNFLVKYPEVNDSYWKMLRLSRVIDEALASRPGDPRLKEAQAHLWRGQGNDAYWHGIFGGCYLPHLRRAVRGALLTADRLLGEIAASPPILVRREDVNGDGRVEITIKTAALSLILNPEAGGSLTEIGYLPKPLDLGDVMTRRPEAYHSKITAAPHSHDSSGAATTIHERVITKEEGLSSMLSYDRFRRASLIEGLFPAGEAIDPTDPWQRALLSFGDSRMDIGIQISPESATIVFSPVDTDRLDMKLRKTLLVSRGGAELHVGYRLSWEGHEPLQAQWGVQWNLAMTAGDAPGRFYEFPGATPSPVSSLESRPSLGSRGEAQDLYCVGLVDEWAGCSARLQWSRPARVAWAPVETVSLSEGGFERIYQGSSLLVAWPLSLSPRGEWEDHIAFTIRSI